MTERGSTYVTQVIGILLLPLSKEGVVQVVVVSQSGEPFLRKCNINSSGGLGGDIKQLRGTCDERVDVGAQFGLERFGIGDTEEEKHFLLLLHANALVPKSFETIDMGLKGSNSSHNVTLDISEVETDCGCGRCGLLSRG